MTARVYVSKIQQGVVIRHNSRVVNTWVKWGIVGIVAETSPS